MLNDPKVNYRFTNDFIHKQSVRCSHRHDMGEVLVTTHKYNKKSVFFFVVVSFPFILKNFLDITNIFLRSVHVLIICRDVMQITFWTKYLFGFIYANETDRNDSVLLI